MTFVDHLKGNQPEKMLLAVAFGTHVVAGHLAKSIVTGADPTHVVKIQQLLGDALGEGWQGPRGVWFRGINRDATKYTFHPGTISTGDADPVQGIDAEFDQDTPHSNTAWMEMECPNGSETGIPDFDTKNNPPAGFSCIMDTQVGDIYDDTGEVTDNGFLTSPADVLAFMCMIIREFPDTRLEWDTLDDLRSLCAVTVTPDYTTLPQGVGLTGKYYDGTGFATFKSQRVDPVIEYDTSSGAPALELDPADFSVRWQGKISFPYSEEFTFHLTHDNYGRLWIDDMSTPLINETTVGTHDATFDATADVFYDIKIEWENISGASQFMFEWESDTQSRQVVPQEQLYPLAEARPRFECHVKFVDRTSLEDALTQVLYTCNGAMQDRNGKLRFFCLADETSSFDFDETNIVKGTFKYYSRYTQQELLLLPNRFIADARDLDSRYLEKFDPPLFYDLPDLQDLTGRVIEETLQIGNTTRWQGLENLTHYAKLKTAPMIAEFDGMPQTLAVLQGDVVTISMAEFGLDSVQFLCVEATDRSTDKAPDNRFFKMVLWQ